MPLDSGDGPAPRVRLLSRLAAVNNARALLLGAAFMRARDHKRRCYDALERLGRPDDAEVARMVAAFHARGGTVRPWVAPESTGAEQASGEAPAG